MKTITKLMMFMINIQLFAGDVGTPVAGTYGVSPLNTTTSEGLTVEMKQFYDNQLLQNIRPATVFNQFGKTVPLPSGKGKTVELRRMETFGKITTPLVEGKIPTGNSLRMKSVTISVDQYGDFTPITDQLNWAAVDPLLAETVNEHSAQANLSLDTLTRNAICGNAENVEYPGTIQDMSALTASSKITADDVARMSTTLKKFNVPKINGSYVSIIHPSVAYDLRKDSGWVEAHKYSAVKELFNGEIGELHGVRFVESTEAMIEISNDIAVYHTLFFGLDAWGTVKPDSMGLRTIIKSPKEIGGPLEQYSTAGWKAMHGAGVLYVERVIDFICASSFSATDTAN